MNKATLQQYLAEAEDHIDDARRRIERQTNVVNELRADGHDTAMAERLLQRFRETLQTLEADRDLIQDLLNSAKSRPSVTLGFPGLCPAFSQSRMRADVGDR